MYGEGIPVVSFVVYAKDSVSHRGNLNTPPTEHATWTVGDPWHTYAVLCVLCLEDSETK